MSKRIILLNGAPSSGKDTIAGILSDNFGYKHRYIANSLVEAAVSLSNVDRYEWDVRYNDRIKNSKELPWDRLGGLSQREFLIKVSEEWMKPVFGNDVFVKKEILSDLIEGNKHIPVVISDCGHKVELDSYIQYYGEDNILLVRVHRDGKTFGNDSRYYLDHKHVVDIQNNTMNWDDERMINLRDISLNVDKNSKHISKQ